MLFLRLAAQRSGLIQIKDALVHSSRYSMAGAMEGWTTRPSETLRLV